MSLLLLTALLAAPTQQPRTPPPRQIIDSLAEAIRTRYVFPALADSAARELKARAARGRIAPDTSLAAALTREGRALLHGDRHFRVLSPSEARERGLVVSRDGAPAPTSDDERLRTRSEEERRLGFYFRKTENLPGNVLLVTFDQFPIPSEEARGAASAVMQLASNADALILDLRANPGGVEGLNQYLASYLFPADTQKILYQRYYREGNVTNSTRVLGTLPGRRMPALPVYILTSRRTGSAAENLAYTLQQYGRAIIVGDTTAGAANSSRFFSLPDGYAVQMPIGRIIHPVSKSNWEGVGVIPNQVVPIANAVDSAHARALRDLRQKGGSSDAMRSIETALLRYSGGAPPSTSSQSPAELSEYVGRFGERAIALVGGKLTLQRVVGPQGAGPQLELAWRSKDQFALLGVPDRPEIPVRFTRDGAGRVQELQVMGRDGNWESSRRTP